MGWGRECAAVLLMMDPASDPFRILSLPYDADLASVRRAFRQRARETHPDRGGSADAFHRVRTAYARLQADLDGLRQRYRPVAPPGDSRYAAGLDPREFPTCRVRYERGPNGQTEMRFDLDSRPPGWRPGSRPPSGGTCRYEQEGSPGVGVWVVRLVGRQFRCVFGPHPEDADPIRDAG